MHVAPDHGLSSAIALRFRLLKHTRLNVVAFLNELPKTQHDINSFVVDISAQTVSPCFLPDSLGLGKGLFRSKRDSGSGWNLHGNCCFSFRTRYCAFPSTESLRKVSILGVLSSEQSFPQPVFLNLSSPAVFSSLFCPDLLFCPKPSSCGLSFLPGMWRKPED